MAGHIGHSESALRSRKETIRHVGGETLLELGLKALHEPREMNSVTLCRILPQVALQCCCVVVEEQLRIPLEPLDQGRLTIVHAAASDESKQRTRLLFGGYHSKLS